MTSDSRRSSLADLPLLLGAGLAAAILTGTAPAAASPFPAEPPIEARLAKDDKTGRIDGHAQVQLDLPAAEVWSLLTDAIHGDLSDRTKLCVSIPPEKADSLLKEASTSLLPLSDSQEASVRKSLLAAGRPEFAKVAPNSTTTGYALRVISIPLPFTADRWFLARETYDATNAKLGRYTITLKGRAGNIAHYDGLWTIESLPTGKTQVTLSIVSDMGIPTPGFLTGLGAGELKETMRRLNRLATQSKAADRSS